MTSIQKIDGLIENIAECYDSPGDVFLINQEATWLHNLDTAYAHITLDDAAHEARPGSTTTFTYQNAYAANELFSSVPTFLNANGSLSNSTSRSWSVGGTLAVGLNHRVWNTSKSAGGNYTYGRSHGHVNTMLIDMNGDGLIDQIGKSGSTVWYRRQMPNHTFASPVTISGLDVLSREVSSSHNVLY